MSNVTRLFDSNDCNFFIKAVRDFLKMLSNIHKFQSKNEIVTLLSDKDKLRKLVENSSADENDKGKVIKIIDLDESYYFRIVSTILPAINSI